MRYNGRMSNCACGCGETAPEGKSFKRGHWSRTPEARVGYTERRIRLAPKNPSGLCECGCGELTPLAASDNPGRGYRAGHHLRFVPGHQVQSGSASHKWKGGRFVHRSGYVFVMAPEHHSANRDGYVLEHRLVIEQHLGRQLSKQEHVHHVDGDKANNALSNLVVLQKRAHHKLHAGAGLAAWRAANPAAASAHHVAAGRKGGVAKQAKRRTTT